VRFDYRYTSVEHVFLRSSCSKGGASRRLRATSFRHLAWLMSFLPPLMKPRGAYETIGTALAGVALVLAGTVVWLLNKPATGDCGGEAAANHKVHEIRAIKVVVQPWLGEHQVYGIFMVPNQYKQNKKYVATLTIRGFDGNFDARGRAKEYVDDVLAKPGYYVKRAYIPTRVALWFLVNGLFGDLRRQCDWSLVFIERAL